jgi:hypothetical protein
VNTSVTATIEEGRCDAPSGHGVVLTTQTVNRYVPGPVQGDIYDHNLNVAAPMRLADLRATPHALVLASGPEEGGRRFACGNIA